MKYRSALVASVALVCLSSVALAASGGVQFRGTGTIGDVTQDAERIVMDFAPRTNVLLGGTVVSDVVRYDGPTLTASVSGGQMRVCPTSACGSDGGWVSSTQVKTGQFVQLRRAGPQAPGAKVAASLSVNGQDFEFSATARSEAPSLGTIAGATADPGAARDSDLATFRGWVEAAITVSGGEYRVCSAQGSCGSFTTAQGVVRDGDQVQLRLVAGTFGESRTASVTAGGASASFKVDVRAKDITPDAFAPFDAQVSQNAPGFVWVTTPRRLTGHDGIDVSVSGQTAEYRLCASADCSDKGASGWMTVVGQAANGQYVQIRLTTGAFGETRSATLVTGTVSSTLAITTRAKDTTPDAFALGTGPTGVAPASVSTSQSATLAGFDDAPISVSGTGASYSLNGGAFMTSAGTAKAGDTVRVQLTAGAFGETRTAVLIVGGTSASWSSVVRTKDTTPDVVTFVAKTGSPSTEVLSDVVQLNGHDGVDLASTGGDLRVCSVATCASGTTGSWATSATNVAAGAYVQLRTTAGTAGQTKSVSLAYGTLSTTWQATAQQVSPTGPSGVLYAVGYNGLGNLGIADNTVGTTPNVRKVVLPSGVSTFTSVTAGIHISCAVGSDGKGYCWGNNNNGQLGIGSTTNQYSPAQVQSPAGTTGFKSIVTDMNHTCGVASDDALYCWGQNQYGQLGTGNTNNSTIPTKVQLPSGVSSLRDPKVNATTTCATGSDSRNYCWGSLTANSGDYNPPAGATTSPVPVAPAGVTSNTASWDSGNYKMCALNANGSVVCFQGSSFSVTVGSGFSMMKSGYNGICGLDMEGAVWCSPRSISTFTKVPMPSGVTKFTDLDVGNDFACAEADDKSIYCAGNNNGSGQFGNGSTAQSGWSTFQRMTTMGNVKAPVLGTDHTLVMAR